MTEIIIALCTVIGGAVSAWFAYRNNKNSDAKKKIQQEQIVRLESTIKELETQMIKAMETCITDVPGLRIKLENYRKQLKKIIGLFIFSCLFVQGCKTADPVVVGERVFYMTAGQTVVVPELKKPAKQWYLIDDVAMLKVLGIDKPTEKQATGISEIK